MKTLLNVQPIIGQTTAWCEGASLLNAISIRLLEKYKINKVFDVNKFFKKNHFDVLSGSEVWSKAKKEIPQWVELSIAFEFRRNLTHPMIEKYITRKYPIVVNISNYSVVNGIIQDGEKLGHFMVLYGFDDKGYFLQNPWGDEYYCYLPKTLKNLLHSYQSVI